MPGASNYCLHEPPVKKCHVIIGHTRRHAREWANVRTTGYLGVPPCVRATVCRPFINMLTCVRASHPITPKGLKMSASDRSIEKKSCRISHFLDKNNAETFSFKKISSRYKNRAEIADPFFLRQSKAVSVPCVYALKGKQQISHAVE